MSWQKCPVCNGTGSAGVALYTAQGICSTCNGHGIISEITGFPPPGPKYITTNGTTGDLIIKFPQTISNERKDS